MTTTTSQVHSEAVFGWSPIGPLVSGMGGSLAFTILTGLAERLVSSLPSAFRTGYGPRCLSAQGQSRDLQHLSPMLTNVESHLLSARQVVALMRLRWQIELLWKLWKQEGKIDTWRSAKPQRILTELYAKLLGLLLAHWVTLEGCWSGPRRRLVKERTVIQRKAPV